MKYMYTVTKRTYSSCKSQMTTMYLYNVQSMTCMQLKRKRTPLQQQSSEIVIKLQYKDFGMKLIPRIYYTVRPEVYPDQVHKLL